MAYLGEQETCLLDDAVCQEASTWQVEPAGTDPPVLRRRWHSARGGLVLVVLGWYPSLVTVGADRSGTRATRHALRRLVSAAQRAGGRIVADSEVEKYVSACRQRWATVVDAFRASNQARSRLAGRECPVCGAVSAFADRRCRGCGHRFSHADDAQRDASAREAAQLVAHCEAEVASLARGAGLLAGEEAA